MSVRFRVDPNQEVAARSLAVCLLASTKAPTARSVSPIISGRPMPNAPMSVAPTPHTTRNATIPRTGCGSLQITSAVSHGHIDPVPGSRQIRASVAALNALDIPGFVGVKRRW